MLISPTVRAHALVNKLRWTLLAACILLTAYLLRTIIELEITTELYSTQRPTHVLRPQLDRRTKHDPERWLAEHSSLDHYESPSTWFSNRPKAAIISLVRNEELQGILQSMRQLEHRWNKRYNYPWMFFSEKPFTQEFKASTASFRLLYTGLIQARSPPQMLPTLKLHIISFQLHIGHRHPTSINLAFTRPCPISAHSV